MCYRGVAVAMENLELCEKIRGEIYNKRSCYTAISIKTGNLDGCDKVNDETDRYSCYVPVAEKNKDLSICENLQTKDYSQYCYFQLATEAIFNENLCLKVSDENKNLCYLKIAGYKQDDSLCEFVKDELMKQGCIKVANKS